ncbi:MAG: hypothetical protein ACOC2Y_04700 [Spirochaetota bacterium]
MSPHDHSSDLPHDSVNADETRPDEIRMKIQALVDNELPESEIEPTIEAIQGSYEYRTEYAELLRLKKRLGSGPAPRPSEDWLEKAERRISRRVSSGLGTLLFIGSYVVLLAYAIYTLFRDPEVPLIVSVLTVTGVVGFVVLLGNAIADRVRESRTDKYRGIIR